MYPLVIIYSEITETKDRNTTFNPKIIFRFLISNVLILILKISFL